MTDDAEPPSSLAQLTAEIVSAYVSNNKIAVSDVAALITAVGSQMAKVGSEIELPTEEKPEPAVPVRRSIQPFGIHEDVRIESDVHRDRS